MAKAYKIGEQMLTLSVIAEIIAEDKQLALGEKAKQKKLTINKIYFFI